ncbi:MAG TPA: lipopolysaccharide biosynthesis protein [Candidatus Limnocylindria bacterium]|nr:lipopolysaccharide biosynthesis protein [Candidatus Limnocylindria bacterium]
MPGEVSRLQALPAGAPDSAGEFRELAEQRAAKERSRARLWLLAKHTKFLACATGTGLLAALGIALLIPPRYESTTRLMPPDSQAGSSAAMLSALARGAGSGLAGLGGEVLGLKSTGVLFVGMMGSRTVQDDVIEKFDLKHVYGVKREEDAQRELARNTEISEDHKSGIITVRVTDKQPERARAMATEYAEELNRLVNQLSTSAAHREREFLEERLKGVQMDLEDAEKQFSQFASKNSAIDIKEQGKAMVEAAATLQGQLIAAESSLEGLKQVYTDQNVRVRSLRARTSELRSQLEKMGGKEETGPQGSRTASDSLYPSLRKLPLLGVTYADLYRRTKVQESVFESLTQEFELAKVEEAKETPSVRVLDPANLPERKSFPPRMLLTLFGSCLALGCGVAWVFGNAAWEEMDPQDPRKILGRQILVAARVRFPRRNGAGRPEIRAGILGRFEQDPSPPPKR